MFRNETIMRQKGMHKVASEYDSLATSNREQKEFDGVDADMSDLLANALDKTASFEIDESLEKKANFSNGLQFFTDVRKMISDKLGVSEGVAHDLSSNVITRSERIMNEYGGDQAAIASNIIGEMKGQVIQNPDLLGGSLDLHPIAHHNKGLQDKIKNRLVTELNMSHREAEVYKTLILKQAQDMTTMLRPHKREEIAMAIVNVVVDSHDVSVIYDLKDTPILMQSIKTELGA